MPAFIKNLTVDCDDALVVARFWAAALGWTSTRTPPRSAPTWRRPPRLCATRSGMRPPVRLPAVQPGTANSPGCG
jgi:Glyoxalase-like domain